jgi:hypothetical protein
MAFCIYFLNGDLKLFDRQPPSVIYRPSYLSTADGESALIKRKKRKKEELIEETQQKRNPPHTQKLFFFFFLFTPTAVHLKKKEK